MGLTYEQIVTRGLIWEKADQMVAPLVEQHGIEKVTFGGGLFPTTTDVLTPIDQHISSIIRVADWLLKEGSDG